MELYKVLTDKQELIDCIKECIRESLKEKVQQQPVKVKEVMTVKELASYLGVRPQTIYNLKNNGRIPYSKKIGLRFIKDDIDKWLTDQ